MKSKQGISLIVLVITIIVMVVLAASVVLTLSNTGIINKANEAVEKTNIKEVEQLASIVWSEEFMNGKRGDTLKSAVLEKLKDYTDKYTITVTDTGVTVMEAGKLNEYGFYYDTVYSDGECAVVATKNGIVEWYYYDEQLGTYWLEGRESVTYEKGKIIFDGWEAVVSNNGKTLSDSAEPEAKLEYTDIEYHDIYHGEKYYRIDNWGYITIATDNTVSIYNGDLELVSSIPGTEFIKTSHLLEEATNASSVEPGSYEVKLRMAYRYDISIDGKYIMNESENILALMDEGKKGTFTIKCEHLEKECQFEQGMTWEEWVNSSYNTVNASINEEYGKVVVPCPYQPDDWLLNNIVDEYVANDMLVMPGLVYEPLHK